MIIVLLKTTLLFCCLTFSLLAEDPPLQETSRPPGIKSLCQSLVEVDQEPASPFFGIGIVTPIIATSNAVEIEYLEGETPKDPILTRMKKRKEISPASEDASTDAPEGIDAQTFAAAVRALETHLPFGSPRSDEEKPQKTLKPSPSEALVSVLAALSPPNAKKPKERAAIIEVTSSEDAEEDYF